jgi:TnpA family transposase
MPRIRNWKDLILYRPTEDVHYEHIDDLFGTSINWALLNTHWQDLMQVVLSIRAGKILPSMILRKLGNYSRKNRLYRAFRELGRAVRTVFLLQYISDIALRGQISATTNKMESFNGFCKWLFFGGDGLIPSKHPVEQEKRIKYNHLIANAVILQNVVDMTMVLRQLAREGHVVNPETLGTLSPYLTENIQRFGSCVLDMDTVPDPVVFEIPLSSKSGGQS